MFCVVSVVAVVVVVVVAVTYVAELSPLRLPSPSDDTELHCLTKCLTSSGTTSSLRCTLKDVACFRRNPNLFFVPSVSKLNQH